MWFVSLISILIGNETKTGVVLNQEAKSLTPDGIQVEIMLASLGITPDNASYVEREQSGDRVKLNWIRLDGKLIVPSTTRTDRVKQCTHLKGHDPVNRIRKIHHLRGTAKNTGLFLASKGNSPQAMVHLEPGEHISITTVKSESNPTEERIELQRRQSRLTLFRDGEGVETCSPHQGTLDLLTP